MRSSTRMRISQRLHGGLLLVLFGLLFAACGQGAPAGSAPGANQGTPPTGATSAAQPSLSAVLAASELVVGQNRLPLGVIKSGTPLNDPNLKVRLRFFYLDSPDSSKVLSEVDAIYYGQGLPFGIYVAYPTFDKAGAWGVEAQMSEAGGTPQISRLRLDVVAQSNTPPIGSPAIPSKNLTSKDVPDLKQLTSDGRPDPDLYQLTIADALAAKKPFLVAFSTPGFCETAVCSPNIEVIKKLKDQFKGQLNFIHVEVYPYPFSESVQQGKRVPALEEWKLESEPWTFLVDAQGIIQARYEGGITFAELEPALKNLAAGQPVQPKAPAS